MTTIKQNNKIYEGVQAEREERERAVAKIITAYSDQLPLNRNFLVAKMCQTPYWKHNMYDAHSFLKLLIAEKILNVGKEIAY